MYEFLCLIKERKLKKVTDVFATLQTLLPMKLKRVSRKTDKFQIQKKIFSGGHG
jgi:hypothetical protein